MTVVVIDGQGGGIGRSLIERLRGASFGGKIVAVGTNSLATSAMLKAGATEGATGENAVAFNCAHADVIAGAIGILAADSMLGELTPKMAEAVGSSPAQKVLIPIARCGLHIAGVRCTTLPEQIGQAAELILSLCVGA